jgi:uncharacterized protein YbjT (DUF2867 family)
MNPINFVSVHDVASLVERAEGEPALRGECIEIGGPENLTFRQMVQTFQAVANRTGDVRHVPRSLLRVMAVVMRPVNPTLARQAQAAVVMDTHDMTFDFQPLHQRFPWLRATTLADVVDRDYGGVDKHASPCGASVQET